jgi:hypothetical protein
MVGCLRPPAAIRGYAEEHEMRLRAEFARVYRRQSSGGVDELVANDGDEKRAGSEKRIVGITVGTDGFGRLKCDEESAF